MAQTALVVDDNFFNRDLARLALESLGVKVTEAEDGKSALNMLKTESYDLLVLDLEMPQVDGLQVLTALREQGQHPKMRIIIVTAYAHMTPELDDFSVDYVLYKPINVQDFVKLIKRLA